MQVTISSRNIATITDTFELIRETQHTLGPIGGIFNLAMVLRDTLIENQTVENYKATAEAKYWGTKNLDAVTRKMCDKEMTWCDGHHTVHTVLMLRFIVFSSVVAGRGNAGQTAYGWANSAMERVIEQRRADGLCAVVDTERVFGIYY
jgi:fatty acid synthase